MKPTVLRLDGKETSVYEICQRADETKKPVDFEFDMIRTEPGEITVYVRNTCDTIVGTKEPFLEVRANYCILGIFHSENFPELFCGPYTQYFIKTKKPKITLVGRAYPSDHRHKLHLKYDDYYDSKHELLWWQGTPVWHSREHFRGIRDHN